jgi:feruloyl esterase
MSERDGNVTAFPHGEPRSGNEAFAAFMDKAFYARDATTTCYFRATQDGIVPLPSISQGCL